MSGELLAVGQMVSIVVAAVGAPGVIFWVMKKMSREALQTIKSNCAVCRKHLDEKIGGLESDVGAMDKRQKALREETLPEKYVTTKFCEVCRNERKDEDQLLHDRISGKHPVVVT